MYPDLIDAVTTSTQTMNVVVCSDHGIRDVGDELRCRERLQVWIQLHLHQQQRRRERSSGEERAKSERRRSSGKGGTSSSGNDDVRATSEQRCERRGRITTSTTRARVPEERWRKATDFKVEEEWLFCHMVKFSDLFVITKS
ncbi:hypothetical protein LINPERPRIM_LOCUS33687 [Linum perenne]